MMVLVNIVIINEGDDGDDSYKLIVVSVRW